MKYLGALWLTVAALMGCDAGKQVEAAAGGCTAIVSAVERLACFDAAAGTPPNTQPAVKEPAMPPAGTARIPDIVPLVKRNEARRQPEQSDTLLLRTEDPLPGQWTVVISAPALGGRDPRPYLVISCLQNISRLQLVTPQPVDVNRAMIRLLLDGRPVSASRPWQVLEDGTVTDAGRGLVAIDQLRNLIRPGQRLEVESDHAPFDGLAFNVGTLHQHMTQQREACHW